MRRVFAMIAFPAGIGDTQVAAMATASGDRQARIGRDTEHRLSHHPAERGVIS